jgi:hypothetical protein
MVPRIFARQNFNVDRFVFHDSFAVLKVHNAKRPTIENRPIGPTWKDDFGFDVHRFASIGAKRKP